MIKGIYSAQLKIDIAIDEKRSGLLPFDQLQKITREKMTAAIMGMMEDEFGDIGTVTVDQQDADLWVDGSH